MSDVITGLIAMWLMFYGMKMIIRSAFPKFSYGPIFKVGKKILKFPKGKGGKTIGKWLYKLLYGNQKDKRGRSFAWFHFSVIGSIVSTIIYFAYGGDLLMVIAMWGLAGLLWKIHGWIKAKTRRPLPGRQRR